MNELCEYTKNLIQTRYNIKPTIMYNNATGFYMRWDDNILLVNYHNIDSITEIRIGFYDKNHIRTGASVNNLLEAYRYITLLINRIAPYKLQ